MENTDRGKTKCCKCCRKPYSLLCIAIWVFIVSAFLAVGSGIAYYFYPQELEYFMNKELSLTPDSASIHLWSRGGHDNILSYFFDITNSYDVQYHGAKPIVKEIGPFGYAKNCHRYDITWNKDQTLIEFTQNVTYTYNPDISHNNDPTNVSVTTINLPLIGLLTLMESIETDPKYKRWKEVFEIIFDTADWLNEIIKYEPLFITKTVDEMLWGYEDPIFKLVHEVDPSLLPSPMFSLQHKYKYYARNVVYTGKNDSSQRDVFAVWNGVTEISEWGTPTARKINGTDAILFKTNLKRDDVIWAFTDDIKINGYFTYQKDVTVDGISAYRFEFPMEEVDNRTRDKGFYPNGPSGVMNLSAVEPFNLPLFASKPHFLDADPGYVNNVTGLKPNRTIHDSFIDIEPMTGMTIRAAKRMQFNIRLSQNSKLKQLEKLRSLTMVPIFYVNEAGSITDDDAGKFKHMVYGIEYGVKATMLTIVGLSSVTGLCMMGCFVILFPITWKKQRRHTSGIGEHTPLIQS